MSIKNISPEDLEKLSKKPKNENLLSDENLVKNIESIRETSEEIPMAVQDEDDVVLKPKKSYFEPDPVPYRLISGRYFVKKNLTSNNEIFVRPWNTEDELKISKISTTDDFNRVCNEIFQSCVKTDIDIYELSLVDKLPLFVFILVITYGSKVSIKKLMDCEICENDKDIDVSVDLLNDLEYKYLPDNMEYPFSVNLTSYPKDDITIKYVYPSLKHEKFFLDNSSDNLFESLRYIIVELKGKKANGKEVTKNDLSDIIKFLNAEDKMKIRKNMNEISNYGINLETDKYQCSNINCIYSKERKKIFLTFENILTSLFSKLKQ
jgi:hypothetical protein